MKKRISLGISLAISLVVNAVLAVFETINVKLYGYVPLLLPEIPFTKYADARSDCGFYWHIMRFYPPWDYTGEVYKGSDTKEFSIFRFIFFVVLFTLIIFLIRKMIEKIKSKKQN